MKDIRYDGRLDFTIDSLGYVKVKRHESFVFPYKNGKEKHSLILPETGSLRYDFIVGGENVTINSGDIFFIPKKCPYTATYLRNDTVISVLLFDADTALLPERLKKPLLKNAPELSEQITFSVSKNSESPMFLASKVYELLWALDEHTPEIPKKYSRIIPAVCEIKEHYCENHDLSHYASLCGMSQSNLRLLFREYIGKSPIEYRNYLRISEAKRLIDSGEYTVSESAYLTGFNNMSFFYEVYNRYYGKR